MGATPTTSPSAMTAEEEARKKREAEEAAAKAKGEGEEKGGLMGFLSDNKGLLGGLALGAVMMFATGGSGILGMLLPLIIGVVASMVMDDNGLVNGAVGAVTGKTPAAGTGSPTTGRETPTREKVTEITVSSGAQMQVSGPEGIVTGVDAVGNPTFGKAEGTPPRGADITIVENGPVGADGKTNPAFKYVGHVEGALFKITGIQAAIPGTNPPVMGIPETLATPIDLPINDRGSINLSQPDGTPLSEARKAVVAKAAEYNQSKDFMVTDVPGKDNNVSITLDPVVKDGVSYETTLIGTRDTNGIITFDRATMTETSGTPPETKPVKVPKTGADEFSLASNPIVARQSEDKEVTLTKGQTEMLSRRMVDYTLEGRANIAAAALARQNEQRPALMASVESAPDASQGINGLQQQVAKNLNGAGVDNGKAVMTSMAVSQWYAESSNRGMTAEQMNDPSNPDSLRSKLASQPDMARMTDAQIDQFMNDMATHHSAIAGKLNDKAKDPKNPASTGADVDISIATPKIPTPAAGTDPVTPPAAGAPIPPPAAGAGPTGP